MDLYLAMKFRLDHPSSSAETDGQTCAIRGESSPAETMEARAVAAAREILEEHGGKMAAGTLFNQLFGAQYWGVSVSKPTQYQDL